MTSITQHKKSVERKKRFMFLGAGFAGAFFLISYSFWLGVPILVCAGYLGRDWFQFRARNGMRF